MASSKTLGATFALGVALAALGGCSSNKAPIYEHESFDDSGTFSRNFKVSETTSCEAARRALLSQGYIITSNDPKLVSGHKSFQQTGDTHMEISFNIVCTPDGTDGHSTVFVNALQDRYALKKTNNSASLGVGVLGSVSMPISSSDDSMVKVASETVTSAKFYERYFALVDTFMPKPVEKAKAKPKVEEKDDEPHPPADALGVPEPKAENEPGKQAEQKVENAEAQASQPVAPPAEPAPVIGTEQQATTAPADAATAAKVAAVAGSDSAATAQPAATTPTATPAATTTP